MHPKKESLTDQFYNFDNALQMYGFDNSQKRNVYMTLSGIIYLNMIEFRDDPNGSNFGSTICESSMFAVERLAKLFNMPSNEITQIMTKRYVRVQNENIE